MTFYERFNRIYNAAQRAIATEKCVMAAKKIAALPSYYPEKERKSLQQRIRDNRQWARKYGEKNEFYTLYGFDVADGPDQDEYLDYWHFRDDRNRINHLGSDDAQLVLLRDKFLFYQYLKCYDIPMPEVFALIRDGHIFDLGLREIGEEGLRGEKDYFLKDSDGECASFVKHIDDYNGFLQVKDQLGSGSYILQRKVVQSAEMDVLNPHAINTLRIVTMNRHGRCYVLTSLLRVGTAKTGHVDNWAVGGLAIGIESTGYLKKYGFYKPSYGLKESVHPDTGVEFSSFRVPGYDDACALACRAHQAFYNVGTIGWDVAITEDGPVFIEGNDNWEISLLQACDRPLRRE